jgi:hypothetical protein
MPCPAVLCRAQLIHPTVTELEALLRKQQDAATGSSTCCDRATLAELRSCALGCVLLLPRLDAASSKLAVRWTIGRSAAERPGGAGGRRHWRAERLYWEQGAGGGFGREYIFQWLDAGRACRRCMAVDRG